MVQPVKSTSSKGLSFFNPSSNLLGQATKIGGSIAIAVATYSYMKAPLTGGLLPAISANPLAPEQQSYRRLAAHTTFNVPTPGPASFNAVAIDGSLAQLNNHIATSLTPEVVHGFVDQVRTAFSDDGAHAVAVLKTADLFPEHLCTAIYAQQYDSGKFYGDEQPLDLREAVPAWVNFEHTLRERVLDTAFERNGRKPLPKHMEPPFIHGYRDMGHEDFFHKWHRDEIGHPTMITTLVGRSTQLSSYEDDAAPKNSEGANLRALRLAVSRKSQVGRGDTLIFGEKVWHRGPSSDGGRMVIISDLDRST